MRSLLLLVVVLSPVFAQAFNFFSEAVEVHHAGGDAILGVELQDIDGNGLQDWLVEVVPEVGARKVIVYRQMAPMVFAEPYLLLDTTLLGVRAEVVERSEELCWVDLNNDQLLDVAWLDASRRRLITVLNPGLGQTFAESGLEGKLLPDRGYRWTSAYATKVRGGDADGDLDADLFVFIEPRGDNSACELILYENEGGQVFTEAWTAPDAFIAFGLAAWVNQVEACDLNGDGLMDVMVAGEEYSAFGAPTGRAEVFVSVGPAMYTRNPFNWASSQAGSAQMLSTVADINGDGRPDILLSQNRASGDAVAAFTDTGSGLSLVELGFRNGEDVRQLLVADDSAPSSLPRVLIRSQVWAGPSAELWWAWYQGAAGVVTFDLAGLFAQPGGAVHSLADWNADGWVDAARTTESPDVLQIVLNDGADVTIPVLRANVFEQGLPAGIPGNTFFLRVEKNLVGRELQIGYQTRAGTATAGIDFQTRSGTVTIPVGQTEGLVPLTVFEDELGEGDETFFVDFTLPDRWRANTLTTEIVIGDSTNSVVAVEPAVSLAEADGTVDITVSKSSVATEVQVGFQLISDSALQGSDFVEASGTLTLPAGTSGVTRTVEVVADGVDEPEESFRLVLSNPVNASLGNDTCTITLTDSDDLVMTMTLPTSIPEDAGTVPLTFQLNRFSTRTVFGDYRLDSGTAEVSPVGDVDADDGVLQQVTFNPLQMQRVINVPVIDDALAEVTEYFAASLVSTSGATMAGGRTFTCQIEDDDTPQLTLQSVPTAEQVPNAEVTLQLSNASTLEVRAVVDLVDREAIAGDDYSRVGFPKEVVIPAGDLSALVEIPLINDARVEPAETFYVRVVSLTGARHDGSDHAVTIRASDENGGFWLEPTSNVVNAGYRTRVFQEDVILGAPVDVGSGMGGMGGMPGMGGATDGSVVSLDLQSGTELWNAMLDFGDGFSHATFGRDGLAVNADVVAAGETFYGTSGLQFLGAVHVFDRGTGALLRTLTASVPQQNTQFGVEVEICGRYLVTSAPNEMEMGGMGGGMGGTGVVYVFDVNTGVEIARLPSPDGSLFGTFGAALAVSPRYLVVGNPSTLVGSAAGKVYVYDTVSQAFLYSITPPNGGGGGDAFGRALVLAGNRLYVGAPGATFFPTNPMEMQSRCGAVFVYELGDSSATLLREHYPEVKEYLAEFGDHLALYGTTLFVGAPGQSGNSGLTARAGSVFGLDAETGEQIIQIISPIPQPNDEFGRSFDYFGSELVVGVPGGGTKGGAYRYTLDRPGYAGWLDRAARACEQVEINFSSGLHPLVAYALGADEVGGGASAPRGLRSGLGPVAVAFEAPALPPVDVAYIIEQSCTLRSDDWDEIARFQSDVGWTGSSFVSFQELPDNKVRVIVHATEGGASLNACFLRLKVLRVE